MISPSKVTGFTTDEVVHQISCESGNTETMRLGTMSSNTSDIVFASNVDITTSISQAIFDNIEIGGKDDVDDFLSETEFALLTHVTTVVGEYDPLSFENIEKRQNFIPILEGRGGNDKNEEGHRRDTIPIADEIDKLKTKTAVFQFLEENSGLSTHAIMSNEALKKFLKRTAHGVIVRVNPGTLSPSSQKNLDQTLRELSIAGITVLSHPDVATSLGAKDVRF